MKRTWLRSALSAVWLGVTASACDPEVTSIGSYAAPTSREFEAESGELSGGFSVGPDPEASNGAFLLSPAGIFDDTPGDALAVYDFSVPIDGVFRIWGRIRSPGASLATSWRTRNGVRVRCVAALTVVTSSCGLVDLRCKACRVASRSDVARKVGELRS